VAIKKGDIVTLHRYDRDGFFSEPAWLRITGEGNEHATEFHNGCVLIPGCLADSSFMLELGQDVAIGEWLDDLRVVPEDEVPDHIWAKIAELALLGDNG
jgi:hypothetical protein